MTDASGKLEGVLATVAGFLPRLPVPCHDANQIHPPEPRLGAAHPAGPVEAEEDEELAHISHGRGVNQRAADLAADTEEEPEYAAPATRVALRPHDPETGEEIDREEVRKERRVPVAMRSEREGMSSCYRIYRQFIRETLASGDWEATCHAVQTDSGSWLSALSRSR